MAKDFGVTSGHSLYSMHRFRQDVRHMVIFDDLIEHGFHRVRLYLTDEAYEVTRSEEKKGHIKIIYHIVIAICVEIKIKRLERKSYKRIIRINKLSHRRIIISTC